MRWYRLDGEETILVDRPYDDGILKSIRKDHHGVVTVSTVFIGMDHSLMDDVNEPILFETMVFIDDDCDNDEICERYSTYQQAIEGHERHVKRCIKRPEFFDKEDFNI